MGQVVETDDGLPCLGEHAHRAFMATGFCGNGCTLGTAQCDDGGIGTLTGRPRGSTCSGWSRGPFTAALAVYV